MSAATRTPYLGEDVHYQAGQCLAAKITKVLPEHRAMLTIFPPGQDPRFGECGFDSSHSVDNTYHYQH